MMMSKKFLSLCCVGLLASASAVHATTMTFEASGNASQGDGPIDAKAVITTSDGQIQITLSNLLSPSAIMDVGEAVADLSFTVSSNVTAIGAATASGQEGNVDGNGNVTDVSGTPGRFIGVGGGVYCVNASNPKNCSANEVLLEAIGGGQPNELILPTPVAGGTAGDGVYAKLNNGAQSHNPYTIGPAVFTLDLTGITAATTISDVKISFGTSPDTFLSARQIPNATPEPSSLLLLGTGIVGAFGMLRRRMVSNQA